MLTDQSGLMLVRDSEGLEQILIQVYWELMRGAEEPQSLKQLQGLRQVRRPTFMSNIEFYER